MSLSKTQRYTYAVGHLLNDVCAALWFTYLLLFLKKVLGFTSEGAGLLFLIGQCADGLANPIISFIIDKFSIVKFYPRRKGWHLLGTIMVSICFLFVLSKPAFGLEGTIYYYMTFIIIFQWGWAFVQLSHLSLIPCLAETDLEKADLNSKRYGMYVVAFIGVYVITYIKFTQVKECTINEETAPHFTTITYICVACGILVSIIFHAILREPEKQEDMQDSTDEHESGNSLIAHDQSEFVAKKWYDWLKYTPTYIMATVFLLARLANNTLGAYLTLYVTDTIRLEAHYIAILPFIQYLFGLVGALAVKNIAKKKSTQVAYVVGSGLVLSACVWVSLVPKETWKYFVIFGLFGTGLNMLVCSAYGLIAEFIGANIKFSAFVYGIFGVGDKVLNGVVVKLLEMYNPCTSKPQKELISTVENIQNFTVSEVPQVSEILTDNQPKCELAEACDYYGNYISRGVSLIVIAGLVFLAFFRSVAPKNSKNSDSGIIVQQSENQDLQDRKVQLDV